MANPEEGKEKDESLALGVYPKYFIYVEKKTFWSKDGKI